MYNPANNRVVGGGGGNVAVTDLEVLNCGCLFDLKSRLVYTSSI